jgi:hypothetical protein
METKTLLRADFALSAAFESPLKGSVKLNLDRLVEITFLFIFEELWARETGTVENATETFSILPLFSLTSCFQSCIDALKFDVSPFRNRTSSKIAREAI